jgi:glycosyltransferase involved in cell wall biosynthesis
VSEAETVAMKVGMQGARRLVYGIVSSSEAEASAPERFALALADSLRHRNEVTRIMSATPAPHNAHPSVSMASPRPLADVAGELNHCDVAIIHHSVDDELASDQLVTATGSSLLDVIDLVDVPTIVVLHNVPAEPTRDQRRMLAQACRSADAAVVTAAPAAVRLASVYGVDPSALWLVRSGPTSRRTVSPHPRRPTLVTWGIIAPGSGIEWMIDAMEQLSALDVRYLVAGPSLDASSGSECRKYREMLVQRCWSRGVPAHVSLGLDDADHTAMTETLRTAVAVIMPQDVAGDDSDGYFEELIAAAVPVVATRDAAASAGFTSDAVVLVPSQDSAALADAVMRVMVDPHLAESIVHHAARQSPPVTWAAASQCFSRIADAAIRSYSTAEALATRPSRR